ncbi:MAG TPA: phosphate ABC transporter permease PstA [Holophaga sp.]|nr:phosphate ABC transporter permease PstA [Holophaga sp.]HPS67720.1 phosphate ABC transporter permease PstA [Holophaga sp.]
MRLRRFKESLFRFLMIASLSLVVTAFVAILATIVVKGASAMNLAMLLETPKGGYYLGKGGGIANAIAGTLYLGLGASLLSLLVGLPAALALQKEYARPWLSRFSRLVLDILWGTPSIVYGAFGFVVMVRFGIRASMLGGILALSLVMLPIMVRSMGEVIRAVPQELKESAYALGTTQTEVTLAVVLRQAVPGILTAILLAFGRGVGDAAALLFTAGYTDYMPGSLLDPVASLPLAIFFQIATPVPEVQARAYAAALILLAIVLAINLASRLLGRRFSRHVIQ